MTDYSLLMTSDAYADFILDNAEYAKLMGYNVSTKRGLTEAMADQFLFEQFLQETTAIA